MADLTSRHDRFCWLCGASSFLMTRYHLATVFFQHVGLHAACGYFVYWSVFPNQLLQILVFRSYPRYRNELTIYRCDVLDDHLCRELGGREGAISHAFGAGVCVSAF